MGGGIGCLGAGEFKTGDQLTTGGKLPRGQMLAFLPLQSATYHPFIMLQAYLPRPREAVT